MLNNMHSFVPKTKKALNIVLLASIGIIVFQTHSFVSKKSIGSVSLRGDMGYRGMFIKRM